MHVTLEPGRYVVAVSGGVDSVVLLDMLSKLPHLKLTIAHFDHGIRDDSADDRRHVEALAKRYHLPFVYHHGKLGKGASEASARSARYTFLHQVRVATGAQAIITAHHQDDLLETAVLNLIRGTGRKGLASLQSTDVIKRPLLHMTKRQLHAYALAKKLEWREDSTNSDEAYLRNYIRRKIMPRFSIAQRKQLLEHIEASRHRNRELEHHLINYLHSQPHVHQLHRGHFVQLPHGVAREVLATWLRGVGIRQFDKKTLERLVIGIKTGNPGTILDIIEGHHLHLSKHYLALQVAER